MNVAEHDVLVSWILHSGSVMQIADASSCPSAESIPADIATLTDKLKKWEEEELKADPDGELAQSFAEERSHADRGEPVASKLLIAI